MQEKPNPRRILLCTLQRYVYEYILYYIRVRVCVYRAIFKLSVRTREILEEIRYIFVLKEEK